MAELKEAPRPKTENGPAQTPEIAQRTPAVPVGSQVSPFAFLRRFAQEMDQLFEDFGFQSGFHVPRFLSRGHELLRREAGLIPAAWSPRVDVLERGGKLVVRADLPGMTKDEIEVELSDDMLTIEGERKHEKKEEREGYHYSERSYGSFYRAIPLPEGIEASKAICEFRNGVLEVTLPAPARKEQKGRRLEIREGK